MYTKIMVPVDGSQLAEGVPPHVEALAKGSQVKEVVFVRVVEPFRVASSGEFVLSQQEIARFEAEHKDNSERYLKGLVGRVKLEGVKCRWEVITGTVAENLADYAAKNAIDLIVTETHGRSGVSRWVWGGGADRILRSSCPPG